MDCTKCFETRRLLQGLREWLRSNDERKMIAFLIAKCTIGREMDELEKGCIYTCEKGLSPESK